MGRPLHTKIGGNVTGTGDQVRIMAHLDEAVGPEPCWISKQTGATRYVVSSVAGGATPTRSGTVYLVGNDTPAVGEGYIRVLPIAVDDGGGALFTSNLKAVTATVATVGAGYVVADTVTVVGGTQSEQAIFDVNDLSTVAGQDETDFDNVGANGTFVGGDGVGGTAYVVADTITLSDGSVITVDAINGNDDVTQFTVTSASTSGVVGNAQTLTQASTSGTGTGFTLTLDTNNQGVFDVTISATDGVYTVIPTNPAATTTGGAGTGVTLNVAFGLNAVAVSQGGDDWSSAPALQVIGDGTGAAATAVLTGDAITSVTVGTAGTGYTEPPRIATNVSGAKFATKLHRNIVKVSDGGVYNVPTEAVYDQD